MVCKFTKALKPAPTVAYTFVEVFTHYFFYKYKFSFDA